MDLAAEDGRGLQADVTAALARAALFRALALGLDDPSETWRAEVREQWRTLLSGTGPWPGDVRAAVVRALESLDVASGDLSSEHVRLFGPAGRVPLTESSWGDAGRLLGKAVALADVGGFYRAFGLEPATRRPRPEDHLAVELEFMSVLALKEAWARNEDEADGLAVTRAAATKFLADHLGTWVGAWCDALAAQDSPEFYDALAGAIRALVASECARLGASPQVVDGRLVDRERSGEVFTCPRADPSEGTT